MSPVQCAGGVELQEFREVYVQRERSVQLAAFGSGVVVAVGAQRVTCGKERTAQTRIVACSHTVVVLRVAVFVDADLRIAVLVQRAYIDRIDRSDTRGVVHQVGGVPRGAQVGVGFRCRVGVTHVGTHLQPCSCLIVCLEACGKALVARIFDDTVFIQIAQAGVERTFVHRSLNADVVFLAECGAVSGVAPVVVYHVVGLAVRLVAASQRGVRVQSAVHADEAFTCGKRVDVVPQVSHHDVVGIHVGSFRALTLSVVIVVVILSVYRFVILARVVDGLIVLHGTAVGTPLHVHVDLRLLVLSAFGGDQDDTGSATRAVQRCGSGILQHCHRFDVLLRNVAQRCAVGSAVHNNQRVGCGVHGGDTTDFNASLACTGGTGTATKLKTGRASHQGVSHVGRDVLGELFRA